MALMVVMGICGAKLQAVMKIEQELQHIREESLLHEDYFILSGFRINKPLLGRVLAEKHIENTLPNGFKKWHNWLLNRFKINKYNGH